MAHTTVELEGSGTLSIDGTITNSSITLGDRAGELHVKLQDTADGTFAVEDSANAVDLDNSVWLKVYDRGRSGDNTGAKVIYFASDSGTQSLQYKVTAR